MDGIQSEDIYFSSIFWHIQNISHKIVRWILTALKIFVKRFIVDKKILKNFEPINICFFYIYHMQHVNFNWTFTLQISDFKFLKCRIVKIKWYSWVKWQTLSFKSYASDRHSRVLYFLLVQQRRIAITTYNWTHCL